MKRIRVMVVTPYYPPSHTAGGTRMSEFVKKLAKEELVERIDVVLWNPHFEYPPPTNEAGSKVHVSVSSFGGRVLGKAFSHHDPNPIFALGWFLLTAYYSLKYKPNRVIFTTPPGVVTLGSAWCRLARIPYVLDYRDYWQDRNRDAIQKTGGLSGVAAQIPARFFEWFAQGANAAALAVVTVHEKIVDKLFLNSSVQPIILSNGIDLDDVHLSTSLAASPDLIALFQDKRVIAYAGQLGLKYYSPEIILPSLSKLPAEYRDVELWVFSLTDDDNFTKAVEAAGLNNRVKLYNLPHVEMLAMLRHATVGLIPLRSDDPQAEFVFPAKLYDYLASGLPVLALSKEGSTVSKFIAEFGNGINVGWGSEKALDEALNDLLTKEEFKNKAKNHLSQFYGMFDRNQQFKQFFVRLK